MFGLFKRREWKPEIVREMKGSYNGVHVVLRNFSCLSDASDGKRKYPYPDFGAEFLAELTERQLGDFDHVRQVLSADVGKTVYVRLRNLPAIEAQVSGRGSDSRQEFYSDLADALIAAFDSHRIGP
jgi:hypothetical protein